MIYITNGYGQGTNSGAEPRQDPGPIYNPVMVEYNGQSNGVGAAPVAEMPAELAGPMTGVKVYNIEKYRWETLQQGINNRGTTGTSGSGAADNPTNQYGTEMRLMYLIKNNYPGTHYLFKYCMSNTDLAQVAGILDWSTTSYELLDRTIAVFQTFRLGMGDGRPSRFIIWMQGENDGQNSTKASNYGTNLTSMINYKRSAYGYTIPYIIVRLSQNGQTGVPFRASVNTGMDSVAGSLASVYTINTDSLTTSDGIHYDSASIETIAQALYTLIVAQGLIS